MKKRDEFCCSTSEYEISIVRKQNTSCAGGAKEKGKWIFPPDRHEDHHHEDDDYVMCDLTQFVSHTWRHSQSSSYEKMMIM